MTAVACVSAVRMNTTSPCQSSAQHSSGVQYGLQPAVSSTDKHVLYVSA